MKQTAFGVCLAGLLVFGSVSACSSSSVDGGNKGGTGAILGGSSAGGTAGSGGAPSNNGGTTSPAAGTSSTAGTGGSGLCAGKSITCIDAMTAKGCDPATGMDVTANCAEEFAKDGLISDGCTMEATGSGCTIDGGSDVPCWLGAQGIAVCSDLTDDQLLGVYVNCFNKDAEVTPVVTCVADFVDEVAMEVDCAGAEAACAQGAGGAPPDGAGGAPPDAAGGAGP